MGDKPASTERFKQGGSTMGLWSSKQKVKVCVVGLDNSGKSTILNKLKPAEASINEVTPTVGFTTEEFDHGNCTFQAWDMSGQSRYRELWQCYFPDAAGIIFVLDSTDAVRMCMALDELQHLLRHPDTAGKPILFFSNKKDRPDSAVCCRVDFCFSVLVMFFSRMWRKYG